MTHIPAIEIVQTLVALAGIALSANAWHYSRRAEIDQLHDSMLRDKNGDAVVDAKIASIRSRRTLDVLLLHSIGFVSGIYVVWWRLQYLDLTYTMLMLIRNATLIVFQFMLMRSTIKDIYDRHEVSDLLRRQREAQAARPHHDRSTDTAPAAIPALAAAPLPLAPRPVVVTMPAPVDVTTISDEAADKIARATEHKQAEPNS